MQIIAFTGLDGSGKTSQAELLVDELKTRHIQAEYVHQFRFSSTRSSQLKSAFRPWMRWILGYMAAEGTAMLTPNWNDAARRGRLRQFITRYLLRPPVAMALFAIGFLRYRAKINRKMESDTVVFDRYFYDELIRLEWKFELNLPLPNLILRFIRHPDIVYYLDASADLCWERMEPKDSTKSAMNKKRLLYEKWLSRITVYTTVCRIDINGHSLADVHRRVIQEYTRWAQRTNTP